jgi:hypothetical protein
MILLPIPDVLLLLSYLIAFNYEVASQIPPTPFAKGGVKGSRRLSPFGKGGGGILFHTVAWHHLFAPFAYFVVPLSLKAFSLQPSVYLPE